MPVPRPSSVDLGIPGYTDVVEIGSGGFGIVYRAYETEHDRVVAIKVLLDGRLDEQFVPRFERERRIMGALSSHPNIVTIFQSGFTTRDQPYIVMEYMARGSLSDRVERDGPLGWQEAAKVGVELSKALEVAHESGILHRDVKPENVLASAYGEIGLADFGIARVKGGMKTVGSQFLTYGHAPPELLDGHEPTVASDVYALGSTILALVFGRPAFERDEEHSLHPMIKRIETDPVPDLRSLGVPDSMCRVLETAMAKDPMERPTTAAGFGGDLQSALDAAPSGDGREAVVATMQRGARGSDNSSGDSNGAGLVPELTLPRRRWRALSVVVALALVGPGLWVVAVRRDPIVQAGGGPKTTIATDPSGSSAPGLGSSPTGQVLPPGKVIYQVAQSRSSEIFVLNLGTGERQRVDSGLVNPTEPTADATGQVVAVTTDVDGGSGVALRRSASEGFLVLPLPANAHTPALSPDGSWLAFVSDASGQDDIYIADLANLEVEQLTDSSSPEFDPAWEPTGDRLAFVRQGSRDDVIVLARPDGSVDATISTPGRKSSPAWSQGLVDGRPQIAFVGEVSGQRTPQTVDPASGEITRAVAISGTPLDVAWTTDMRLLVARASEGLVLIGADGDVQTVDATQGAAAPHWFGL